MTIKCPFVYANGKQCTGHVAKIEAYKATVEWSQQPDGSWDFSWIPRSHYHLFCSEKSNHAGNVKSGENGTKYHWDDLPDAARSVLENTRSQGASTSDANS